MKNKRWLFAAILLISGSTLLPFGLEVVLLIEFFGLLGLWTMYAFYAQYLANHPNSKRALRLANCCDAQPQMRFSSYGLKTYPQLVFHMFPIQSVQVGFMAFVCGEFGGERGLREVGLYGIHPLTQLNFWRDNEV